MFSVSLALYRQSFDRDKIYIFGNLIFHPDKHSYGSPLDPSVGMGNELAALFLPTRIKIADECSDHGWPTPWCTCDSSGGAIAVIFYAEVISIAAEKFHPPRQFPAPFAITFRETRN